MHVDSASGGFVAPFSQPELVWDFALPRVHSINASGHKYGLVYPGVGWAIWRDAAALPRELVFDVNYLGGSMPTFALNFSRPGSEVLAQYFMFLALGKQGYGEIQRSSNRIAHQIATQIAAIGPYRLITDGSELPVVAFTLAPEVTNYTVFDVSARLREFGWLVPAYSFPEHRQDLSVLRVVVRAGLTTDMADLRAAPISCSCSSPHNIFRHRCRPTRAASPSRSYPSSTSDPPCCAMFGTRKGRHLRDAIAGREFRVARSPLRSPPVLELRGLIPRRLARHPDPRSHPPSARPAVGDLDVGLPGLYVRTGLWEDWSGATLIRCLF